jgi:DNA-binding transcriptional ArsR family regulator
VSKEVDDVFAAVLDEWRQLALRRVREHRSLTLADLADEVAVDDHGTTLVEVPADRVRDIYLQFYHCHLPYLRDADLVRYDQERDLVFITDRGDRVAAELAADGVEAFA